MSSLTRARLPRTEGGAVLRASGGGDARVPTIFSGTDPPRFYSLDGWGIPFAGGLLLTGVLMVAVANPQGRRGRSTRG